MKANPTEDKREKAFFFSNPPTPDEVENFHRVVRSQDLNEIQLSSDMLKYIAKEYLNIKSQNVQLKSQLEQSSKDSSEAHQKHQAILKELQVSHQTEDTLDRKLAELRADLSFKQGVLEERNGQISVLSNNLKGKDQTIKTLDSELTELRRSINSQASVIVNRDSQIAFLKQKMANVCANHDNLQSEVADLTIRLKDRDERLVQLTNKNAENNVFIRKESLGLHQKNKTIETLQAKLKVQDDALEKIGNDLKTTNIDLEKSKIDLANSREVVNQKIKIIEKLQETIKVGEVDLKMARADLIGSNLAREEQAKAIDSLKINLKVCERKIDSLTTDCFESTRTKTIAEDNLSALMLSQHNTVKQLEPVVKDAVCKLQTAFKEKDATIERQANQIKEQDKTIDNHEIHLKMYETELRDLESKNAELISAQKLAQDKLGADTRNTLQRQSDQIKVLQDVLKNCENKLHKEIKLGKLCSNTIERQADEIKEQADALKIADTKIQDYLKTVQDKIFTTERQADEIKQQANQIKEQDKTISQLQASNKPHITLGNQVDVEKLKSQLQKDYHSKLEDLTKSKDTVITKLQADLSWANQNFAMADNPAAQKGNTIEKLDVHILGLTEQVREKDSTIAKLQGELDQTAHSLSLSRDIVVNKSNRIEQLTNTIHKQLTKIKLLSEQIQEKDAIIVKNYIQAKPESLSVYKIDLDKSREIVRNLEGENTKLKNRVEAVQREIELVKHNCQEKERELIMRREKAEADVEIQSHRHDIKKKACKVLTQQINDLQAKLDSYSKPIVSNSKTHPELESQLETSKAELLEVKYANLKLQAELEKVMHSKKTLEKQLDTAQYTCKQLASDNTALTYDLETRNALIKDPKQLEYLEYQLSRWQNNYKTLRESYLDSVKASPYARDLDQLRSILESFKPDAGGQDESKLNLLQKIYRDLSALAADIKNGIFKSGVENMRHLEKIAKLEDENNKLQTAETKPLVENKISPDNSSVLQECKQLRERCVQLQLMLDVAKNQKNQAELRERKITQDSEDIISALQASLMELEQTNTILSLKCNGCTINENTSETTTETTNIAPVTLATGDFDLPDNIASGIVYSNK